jgi:hypothetical protein
MLSCWPALAIYLGRPGNLSRARFGLEPVPCFFNATHFTCQKGPPVIIYSVIFYNLDILFNIILGLIYGA